MSRRHDPIVVGSSDVEDDEVAFVGSTMSVHIASRQTSAIVIDSDSDDEQTIRQPVINGFKGKARSTHQHAGVDDVSDSDDGRGITPTRTPATTAALGTTLNIEAETQDSLQQRSPLGNVRLSNEGKLALREKEKRDKQLSKAAAKAAKEAEKSFQKKIADVNRLRTTKSDTVKDIRLWMSADLALPTSPIAGALPEIQARFKESMSEIHFQSEQDSLVPGSIRIKRHIRARWDTTTKRFLPIDEPFWEWDQTTLVVIEGEDIVDKLSQGHSALVTWIQDTRLLLQLRPSDQIVVVIKGLGKYHSKTRTLANREYTAAARAGIVADGAALNAPSLASRLDREETEQGLVSLQVQLGVFIVQVERTEDMEDWVWNLCADAALRPYKLLSKSHLSFAAADIKRKASETTDALELMLQEVQGITPSAAAGIAAEYPTFADLMDAFEAAERRGGEAKAESLLAECEVRNLKNGTASGRKLNKALAKRVYQLFRGEDSLALA